MSRPTKEAEPGTQVTISLRVPAELKTRLEARAAQEHRNLSQECERALERSFDPAHLFSDAITRLHAMGEANAMARFTVVAEQLRRMCRSIFGEEGEIGFNLMRSLAMARSPADPSSRYTVDPETLDVFRQAVSELERLSRSKETTRQAGKPASEVARAVAMKVRDAMLMRIASGEWKPNTAIPSERTLASEFGVGHQIIHEALTLLERERLVTRRALHAGLSKGGSVYLVVPSSSAAQGA